MTKAKKAAKAKQLRLVSKPVWLSRNWAFYLSESELTKCEDGGFDVDLSSYYSSGTIAHELWSAMFRRIALRPGECMKVRVTIEEVE